MANYFRHVEGGEGESGIRYPANMSRCSDMLSQRWFNVGPPSTKLAQE